MSDLTGIPFEKESGGIKNAVTSYWSKRAGSFSEHKHDEAHSYKAELWRNEIAERLPAGDGLRVLDVGCGSGFFEMVLAPLGYRMTGSGVGLEERGTAGIRISSSSISVES